MECAFSRARTRGCASFAAIALVLVVAVGCAEPSASPQTDATTSSALAGTDLPSATASVGDQLGRLRAIVAPFHDFETAKRAGYEIKVTDCMENQPIGGMGFHYGKLSAIVDGIANPLDPDVLLYEPEKSGKLRLVGVELVVRYSERPRSATPPEAFGQQFVQNDGFQLWALHVWVARHNPAGIFKDWNPVVNCNEAAASARVSHNSH